MTFTTKVNSLAKSDREIDRLAASGAAFAIVALGITTIAFIGYFLLTQTLSTLAVFGGVVVFWMIWSAIYVSIRG